MPALAPSDNPPLARLPAPSVGAEEEDETWTEDEVRVEDSSVADELDGPMQELLGKVSNWSRSDAFKTHNDGTQVAPYEHTVGPQQTSLGAL